MKRFIVYRPNPPENYVKDGYANPSDQVQFEGVQFTDGTVAVRWRTETRSTSLWDSLESLMKIHGHPEYKTIFKWLDAFCESEKADPAVCNGCSAYPFVDAGKLNNGDKVIITYDSEPCSLIGEQR